MNSKRITVIEPKITYRSIPVAQGSLSFYEDPCVINVYSSNSKPNKKYLTVKNQDIKSIITHKVEGVPKQVRTNLEIYSSEEVHLVMSPDMELLYNNVIRSYKESTLNALELEIKRGKHNNKLLRKTIHSFNEMNWLQRIWFSFSGKTIKVL